MVSLWAWLRDICSRGTALSLITSAEGGSRYGRCIHGGVHGTDWLGDWWGPDLFRKFFQNCGSFIPFSSHYARWATPTFSAYGYRYVANSRVWWSPYLPEFNPTIGTLTYIIYICVIVCWIWPKLSEVSCAAVRTKRYQCPFCLVCFRPFILWREARWYYKTVAWLVNIFIV
jgi:hypothetical protein